MTRRHVILGSFAVPAAFSIWFWLSSGIHEEASETVFMLIILFGLWGVGLTFGLILSGMFRKPSLEPWLFIAGQVMIYVFVGVFIGVIKYERYARDKDYGNIEFNHDFVQMDSSYDDTLRFSGRIRKAFYTLESQFAHANDFRLESFTSVSRDTFYNGRKNTVYDIFFTYRQDDKDFRFAIVRYLNDTTSIIKWNGDPVSDPSFIPAKSQQDQSITEAAKYMQESVRVLEDSLRRAKSR